MRLKGFAKICDIILALLGFASVSSCGGIWGAEEYGMPYMDFAVKGKVVDAETNPIKDIAVSPYPEKSAPATRSQRDGSFIISGSEYPSDTIRIYYRDVDGIDNGGEFLSGSCLVKLTQVEKGEGNWYKGVYAAEDVVIVLEKEVEE